MSFEFYCATDTGRARSNNEDSVALDEATRLLVLADGMGGYNAGEVASDMASATVLGELTRWLQATAAHELIRRPGGGTIWKTRAPHCGRRHSGGLWQGRN